MKIFTALLASAAVGYALSLVLPPAPENLIIALIAGMVAGHAVQLIWYFNTGK